MHLLREGQFDVAEKFVKETRQRPQQPVPIAESIGGYSTVNPILATEAMESYEDFFRSDSLQERFSEMYQILKSMRSDHNLLPAIEWCQKERIALESRGSHLEFDLQRLQFIWLFMGKGPHTQYGHTSPPSSGPGEALAYARREFSGFQGKYLEDIQRLMGAVAFLPNLVQSPYNSIFYNPTAWEDVAKSFTREFCSLLGLSADSPLYIAATAGAIALPTLLKLQNIMKEKRTEWTSANELPVCIIHPTNSTTKLNCVRLKFHSHHHTFSTPSLCVLFQRSKQRMRTHL
jgi:E3 ubiquitin-protein transferase RMND5